MFIRAYNFLNDTHQIYESQYGFRAKHSCEHVIGELLSEITKKTWNQGNKLLVPFWTYTRHLILLSTQLSLRNLRDMVYEDLVETGSNHTCMAEH